MTIESIITGIIQLIISIALAVLSLYIGFGIIGNIGKIDEEEEISRGNVAVGILVASIFISISLVVQSGVAGVSVGLKNALAGDLYPLIAGILQLILGEILAVAIELAGVIITVGLIIQSGVLGITSSLF